MSYESDIPRELLEKVNEHTRDGFIVFYTDKDGNLSYTPYTKSPTTLAGLLTHAKSMGIAFETTNLQKLIQFYSNDT